MTTAAALNHRRRSSVSILTITGPADSKVRKCIFCNQVFQADEAWYKVGLPGCYIGAHVACSERKDAELLARGRS